MLFRLNALFTTRTNKRIIPTTITAGNRAVGLKSQVVLLQTAHSCNLGLMQEFCWVRACIESGVPGTSGSFRIWVMFKMTVQ